jgi:hypothetical protein
MTPRFTFARLLLALMFCALLLGLAAVLRQTSVRSARIQWLQFSPDGQYLAMGLHGLDHDSVQVWDVPDRTRIVNFDVMAADETLVLSPLDGSVRFSGNNELVTVDYPEEGLNRWDLRKQDLRPTTEASPGWLSPDGNWLLTERPDGALEVRDIGANRPPVKLALREPEVLFHVYFAADRKTLGVWRSDGMIETYDLRSGKHRRSIQVQKGLPGVLSPDLRWAAARDADPGIVHVYRMDDGAQWLTTTRENGSFPSKAFSHDSRSLAIGDDRGTVTLWDLASRQPRASASGPGMVSALAFSPDGASLAVGHRNRYRWFRQTPTRLVDPVTLDEQAVLGESNYRPHMAVLLAGFVVWLVCWRWARGRRRSGDREQSPAESPDASEVLLHENVPGAKAGRFWLRRELTLTRAGLVIARWKKQLTIPRESIDKLTSEGRWGARHFRVVHHDEEAPADIRFHSFHPAKWFEAFEQAGIPVEDPVDLRSSWALAAKLGAAAEIIEGLFWALVIGGAVVVGLIAALVNGCAG